MVKCRECGGHKDYSMFRNILCQVYNSNVPLKMVLKNIFFFCLSCWSLGLTLKQRALLPHNLFLFLSKEYHNRKTYLQRDTSLSTWQVGSTASLLCLNPQLSD